MSRISRLPVAVTLVVACAALAACQSSEAGIGFSGAPGARVDAPGVPISLESIEGAPESLKGDLAAALAAEASARRVEIVSAASAARYRLRGYLKAYDDEAGRTRLAFVWDIFDRAKRRARRLEGSTMADHRGAGDPWGAVDKAELQRLASQSMNEIAGFLVSSSAGS